VRIALVLAAVVLGVAAAAVPVAGHGDAACSRATASAALKQVKPHITGLGDQQALVTPANADQLICFDFTRDGRGDLALTVASGGTAGDIGWIVLQRTGSGWRLAHSEGGYKVGLFRVGGDLVDSNPIYGKKDPNCCPTGGFDHERWHWNGSRFVRVRLWHTKSYKP
jgi:hypothetical protein